MNIKKMMCELLLQEVLEIILNIDVSTSYGSTGEVFAKY